MKLRRSKASDGRQRLRYQGSLNSAFNYRARRSDSEINTGRGDSRATKQSIVNRHFWLQRIGIIVLSLAIIASVVNVLTLSSSARIILLTNSSGSPQNLQSYQTAADQLLRGSIWNRNKITINTGAISQQLRRQFTQLASVSVTIPLIAHRPLIYIQPAQPALILVNNSGAYTLDAGGNALLRAANPTALQQPKLPIVNDQSGLKVEPGQRILPAADVTFIETVTAQLAAQHVIVSTYTLPAAASELDAQLTGKPYLAKFNLANNDARQQAGTLLATMSQLQSQNITPAKYIDVRVDGRAYYQ